MAEGFFCSVCMVLVWDGLLAELLDLLAELDRIPALHYGILVDGGWLPAERDLLKFNAVGFSFGRKASLLKFTCGVVGFTRGRGAFTRGTGWNTPLYYRILADGGYLPVERDLLEFN